MLLKVTLILHANIRSDQNVQAPKLQTTTINLLQSNFYLQNLLLLLYFHSNAYIIMFKRHKYFPYMSINGGGLVSSTDLLKQYSKRSTLYTTGLNSRKLTSNLLFLSIVDNDFSICENISSEQPLL
jgi:hypothetical protein